MVSWQKLSASIGSATTDPVKGEATAQPVPTPAVANKPPPGRKGPVGMQPRQTYSRVNTGTPPIPDAGTMTQKSQRPRGLEFLPAKVAQQEIFMTTMMRRPSLSALVKEAMEGTASQVDINTEAMFQQAHISELPQQEKIASVSVPDVVPTSYVEKVAAALDYLSKQAEEGTNKLEPGKGPGALEVMEATSSEENYDVNDSGQAKTQIPMTPAMTSSGVAKDPSNAMSENTGMSHPEQPVDPMGNEKLSAANMLRIYEMMLEKLAAPPSPSAGQKAQALKDRIKQKMENVKQRAGAERRARNVKTNVLSPGEQASMRKGRDAKTVYRAQAPPKRAPAAAAMPKSRPMGGGGGGGTKIMAKPGGKGGVADKIRSAAGKLRSAAGSAAGKAGKFVSKHRKPLGAAGAAAGLAAGGYGAYKALGGGKKKAASANLLARNLHHLGLYKEAEDAINPASIGAGKTQTGATPPEGASPSEESVPSEPSDVNSQKGMIASNQAAIDYTKGKAKADPKSDVNKVLNEPALTSATDKVLQNTFDNTGKAGVKVSHIRRDLTKTAAAQALLSKIAMEAEEEKKTKGGKKEKNSQGMSPMAPLTGASAGQHGGMQGGM